MSDDERYDHGADIQEEETKVAEDESYEREYNDDDDEEEDENKKKKSRKSESTLSPGSSSKKSVNGVFPTGCAQDLVNRAKTKLLMEEKTRREMLRNKKPFNNNRCGWIKLLQIYINVPEKKTQFPLYSTFLSNGTLRCDRQTYVASLPQKAKDIDAGVVFTDNELANNVDGYNLFTEVDWKHLTLMPTVKDIFSYMACLQKTIKQCYPNEDKNPLDYHISCCKNEPYVKLDKEGIPIFSCGFHFICRNIPTTSIDNHRIAGLVDIRTLKECPIWHKKTDIAPYHNSYSNLRPVFSHKMDPCELCNKQLKQEKQMADANTIIDEHVSIEDPFDENDIDAPKPKRRRMKKVNAMSSVKNPNSNGANGGGGDDFFHQSRCGSCFKQKIIQPNHYRLRYEMDTDGNFFEVAPNKYTTFEEIKLTSIVLQSPKDKIKLIPTDDMPTVADLQPEKYGSGNSNKLTGEKDAQERLMMELQAGSKLTDQITFLSQLVNRFIALKNPEFAHVVADFVAQKNKSGRGGKLDFLMIVIKGRGAQYCMLQNGVHGNHCYYKLKANGILYFHCHRKDCSKILMAKPTDPDFKSIELRLTTEENQECQKLFGFSGMNYQDLLAPNPMLLATEKKEFTAMDTMLGWTKKNIQLQIQQENDIKQKTSPPKSKKRSDNIPLFTIQEEEKNSQKEKITQKEPTSREKLQNLLSQLPKTNLDLSVQTDDEEEEEQEEW